MTPEETEVDYTPLKTKNMNLPYIQSELFHELVGMETLLKPEYRFYITKFPTGKLFCTLWNIKIMDNVSCIGRDTSKIDISTIKTQADITAEINSIWDAIPAEYKREDILK